MVKTKLLLRPMDQNQEKTKVWSTTGTDYTQIYSQTLETNLLKKNSGCSFRLHICNWLDKKKQVNVL